VEEIERLAIPLKGHEDVAHIAAISSQSEAIGELIADAMDKVGKDGEITVEDSQGLGNELEVVEGMQFDRGYASPYMATNPDRMEAVLDDGLGLEGDQRTGVMIVRRALEEPLRQIAQNAGEEGSVIVEAVRGAPPNHGYDALNDRFVNMFEFGIVDPGGPRRTCRPT
jgi:chaperonin GroEL